VLRVLSHGDLGELGHHLIGLGAADVGQRECRFVGGNGQILNGGCRLEDLHVGRAARRGGRGQRSDEDRAPGRAEHGGTGNARVQRARLGPVEVPVGRHGGTVDGVAPALLGVFDEFVEALSRRPQCVRLQVLGLVEQLGESPGICRHAVSSRCGVVVRRQFGGSGVADVRNSSRIVRTWRRAPRRA
jgi:hypothetical protein